jgi:NAD(P)H-flavin reductase
VYYRLREGDRAAIEGPFGDAFWRPGHVGPIVLAATGAGLAPMKSILRATLQHWIQGQRLYAFLGVGEERDVYDEEALTRLVGDRPAVKLIYALAAPTAPTWRRIGLIQDLIARDIPDFGNVVLYAAGSPAMVETVASLARRRNANPNNVRVEPFYAQVAAGEHAPPLPRLGKLRRLFRS